MHSLSIEQAQAEFSALIERLKPGEEVEITKDNRTVAKIVSQREARVFGLGKGKLIILKESDDYLKDFEDSMS